jgi:type II secretory pathway component GspD/PulD (secretin)
MSRLLLLVAGLLSTTQGFAQNTNTAALIAQQLDQPYKADFRNEPLPQVLRDIANTTGVRIETSAAVYDLLPWGDQTTISAKIDNQTLRQALDAMTRKLGLTYVLKDNFVELQPTPGLARLGQRSTLDELKALDVLASTPLALPNDQVKVSQLIDAIDQKLVEIKSPYAVENRLGDRVPSDKVLSVPRNATLMQALEALATQTNGTWYPWEKSIVLLPDEEQIRKELNKSISVRYDGADVAQVLSELSQRSGVEFTYEPGAIQRIPPEFRRIRLVLDNATIKQALETLAGFTGLGYVVNDAGVYFWNATYNTAGAAGGQRDPVIGSIQLDNGTQVFLRESTTPPDLREYIAQKTRREFDKLRQQMKEEGFKPTSQPTTKPAES